MKARTSAAGRADGTGIARWARSLAHTGGAEDRAVIVPDFSLHVQELISSFEKVTNVCWCSHSFGPHDTRGAHVSIEGVYEGHEVWLQVLAEAPEDEEPGFKVDL